ncbi:MAG: 4Fe-4S binding protein [Spirochaetaceae bacterium]
MKTKIVTKIRLSLLAAFIIFISYEAYMHQVKGGGPDGSPSIHALCPYGGLESLYTIFTTGDLLSKIYTGTLVLFVVSIILAIIFRRTFCAWICPLGGIQEFLGRLGKKVMGKQLVMPKKIDKALRYLKYPILAITTIFAWTTATLWMSPYDPWAAYGHLGEGISAVWSEFPIGFIILLITFIGSFLYDRFFCKYLCPMGGFLGLISKISPFKIKREKDICIDCDLCSKACFMNIEVAKLDEVTSMECINCQECTIACPKEGALNNKMGSKGKLNINPLTIGVVTLIIYFGGIGISSLIGQFKLLPNPIDSSSEVVDASELKGYMTLLDIAIAMNLSLEELYEKMEIPNNISSEIPMKEMKDHIPGFDFHEAKDTLEN